MAKWCLISGGSGWRLTGKQKTDEQMRRTCHGNHIQGGGTKGHINLLEKAIFYSMEFDMYAFKFQQINRNIYV
jgi:hypothetical protein